VFQSRYNQPKPWSYSIHRPDDAFKANHPVLSDYDRDSSCMTNRCQVISNNTTLGPATNAQVVGDKETTEVSTNE
jgi:hypothetical protein